MFDKAFISAICDQLAPRIIDELKPLLEANNGQKEKEEIITEEELCSRLQITKPTAGKWRAKKKLPYLLLGNQVRYNWPAVIKKLNIE